MKPSEILNLNDPVAAYCFDKAIYLFGSSMQSDLDNADRGAKNPAIANGRKQQVISKWLGIEPQYKSPGGPSSSGTGDSKTVDSEATRGPVRL